MKKNIGIRSALFTLLILVSICSYIYLNMVDVVESNVETAPLHLTVEPEIEDKPEVLLPDVEIIKKVAEKALDLIPQS